MTDESPHCQHVTEVYDDGGAWHGPTWAFKCLTCGVVEQGFIKRRYAEADALQHTTSGSDPQRDGAP